MILCYYHDCLDGICSAAIINKIYGDVRCIPVQYNKDTWNIQKVVDSDEVFVVDFTFPDMEKLVEIAGDKLHWIDHHKTAMETHKELWDSDKVHGWRSLDYSGCGLTWKYCYNKGMPWPVVYIEDRDLWRFAFPETKAFCIAAGVCLIDPYQEDWMWLLNEDDCGYMNYFSIGNALITAQERRVKKLFKNGIDINFHGYKARLCNTTSDISELGEYIYSQENYDIAVMWQVIEGKIIVSLRSNILDCAKIAQLYSGGGHQGAAGFSILNQFTFPAGLF